MASKPSTDKVPDRMWIVGVSKSSVDKEGGKHIIYRCFHNDLVSAQEYAELMIPKGHKVALWDMMSDRWML